MAMARRRGQYNPHKIKHHEINRFRGVMASEPKAMLPPQFVGDSENLVSRLLGQVQVRDGLEDSETASVTGSLVVAGDEASSQAFCIGASLFVVQKPLGDADNQFMELPIQDQASQSFGVHTYA